MAEMRKSEATAAVRSAAMFSALSDASARTLLGECPLLHLHEGAIVCRPTQTADRFYVILRGRVKVSKLSARGGEQVLHLFSAGESFGEAAMWENAAFPAQATTLCESDLLVVTRVTLKRLIAEHPQIAMGMLAGMSRKLREFARIIEDLSLRGVPERLATLLLEESRSSGGDAFELRHAKRELAARIGAAPETFSRALKKMKELGLVEVRGARVRILDAKGLDAVAVSGFDG
jgi:CRP/FNR family transcriptional regulator